MVGLPSPATLYDSTIACLCNSIEANNAAAFIALLALMSLCDHLSTSLFVLKGQRRSVVY